MYVNLWFKEEKKARNADIDVLEIRNTADINYDLAIHEVLDTLLNDHTRKRKYVRGIPVILKDNPPIPGDSMQLLRHEFGGLSNGR